MNTKVKVTDINYDTDGQKVDLPKEMTLEIEVDNDLESCIADAISDKTGWCVFGYNYEIV